MLAIIISSISMFGDAYHETSIALRQVDTGRIEVGALVKGAQDDAGRQDR